jgi:predicted dehydrogenase
LGSRRARALRGRTGERALALERGAYERFYAGVRDALRDGTAMPVDPRDSVAALRVIGAARRSARTAAVIDTTQEEAS